MAHDLKVPDPVRFDNARPKIVSPVRFTRYRGGGFGNVRDRALVRGEPPLEDHGFAATSDLPARGPVVGFGTAAGRDNRFTVQVVRDFISPKAKLFPVIDDPSVATVVFPAGGGSIPSANPADAPYDVEQDRVVLAAVGLAANTQRATVLRLHHDRPDGPVVAEMNVVVYGVTPIVVRLHAVAINLLFQGALTPGVAPNSNPREVRQLFDAVNVIYEQVGIELQFADLDAVGNPRIHQVDNTGFADHYGRANCVSQFSEQLHVLTLGGSVGVLNAFLVQRFCGVFAGRLGFGLSHDNAAKMRALQAAGRLPVELPPAQPGLIMVTPGDDHHAGIEVVEAARRMLVHTVAHELGHCLGLAHYHGGDTSNPEDAQSPNSGPPPPNALSHVRHDLWAHTNLMHNEANLQNGGRVPQNNDLRFYNSLVRARIGYGQSSVPHGLDRTLLIHAGQALAIRDRPSPADPGRPDEAGQGNQVAIVRKAAGDKTYLRF
ncbi:MAG: hypothetical protein ABJE95_20615 [Byssovorax sp.]